MTTFRSFDLKQQLFPHPSASPKISRATSARLVFVTKSSFSPGRNPSRRHAADDEGDREGEVAEEKAAEPEQEHRRALGEKKRIAEQAEHEGGDERLPDAARKPPRGEARGDEAERRE